MTNQWRMRQSVIVYPRLLLGCGAMVRRTTNPTPAFGPRSVRPSFHRLICPADLCLAQQWRLPDNRHCLSTILNSQKWLFNVSKMTSRFAWIMDKVERTQSWKKGKTSEKNMRKWRMGPTNQDVQKSQRSMHKKNVLGAGEQLHTCFSADYHRNHSTVLCVWIIFRIFF